MALLECLTLITGPAALFFSVLTYVLTGEQVTPAKTFMLLSFLSTLRTSLLTWSTSGISMLLEAIVSLNRIERFLLLENLPFIENEQDRRITDVDYKSRKSTDSSSLIFVRNCLQQSSENLLPPKEGKRTLVVSGLTCKLTDPIKKTVLENVSFEAADRALTVITGHVGCAKSTLLSSIVGEIELSEGKIRYLGNAAFVSQSAWVFSGTVQENILFGKAFDEDRFAQVIEVCALKEDLERLTNGSLTFVGEQGSVLSGGQRARVSLARAVYADADIYLLDDPLSAVDVKVGDHIFNKCISEFLRDKTRIMVSYNENYMKLADQVVVLDKGSVLGKGVYSELKQSNILNVPAVETQSPRKEEIEPALKSPRHTEETTGSPSGDEEEDEHLELSEEDRAVGSITAGLYWDYFRAGMHPVVMFLVFAFFLGVQGE